MKSSILVLSLTLLVGSVAQATFIDDFSTDTSAKYDTLCTWDPGGGPSAYARNVSDQFAPTGGYSATTLWLRNDDVLDVGDAVRVDLCNIAYVEGLVLSKSLTEYGTTAGSSAAIYALNSAGNYTGSYTFQAESPNGSVAFTQSAVADLATTSAPITLTLSRTSDTTAALRYEYWGQGVMKNITTNISGLTAGSYYVGMVSNPGMNAAVFDNLSIGNYPVPEPSAIMIVLTGLLGLLAYAWRRRK